MVKSGDLYGTYGSEPSVAAEGGGGSSINVKASPNAFGAGVAAEVEDAGQKQTDLTLHYQDIYNDSVARDAVVANSVKLGDAENTYRQNRGINAPAAYKTFQDTANQIYEQGASAMPNMAAQKLFRDQFSRETAYSIKSAGAWAADQAEQGYVTSLNSSMASKVNQFAMAPSDPARRTELASGIKDDALQYAHFKGLDSDTADQLVSHNVGEGYATLIKTTAQTDPALAHSLYEEAANGTFKAVTENEDGTKTIREIPYLDAAHRATIAGEMSTEFRRQFSDQYQSAMTYAKLGVPYDKQSFIVTAKNAGHTESYINAEMQKMDAVQQKFATDGAEYNLTKTLQADGANALQGAPIQGNYDPAIISAAYPNDPQKVQQISDTGDNLKQVASESATFTTKTPAQIFQAIEKYKPQQTPVATPVPVEGQSSGGTPLPDFQLTKNIDEKEAKLPSVVADAGGETLSPNTPVPTGTQATEVNPKQQQLYDMMKASATQYVQQLYQDPSGTLASKDKVLYGLLDAGIKDPSKLGIFVDASMKQQIALGVPENLRTALPANVAASFVQNITANPEGAADTFSKLSQQTGAHWPDVYHSMVTRGNLPTNYQIIAQLSENPNTQKDATLLSKWYSDDPKGKLTSDLVGAKNLKDINKTIMANSSMVKLQQSLASSGASKGQIAATTNTIEALAAAKVYYNRTDPKSAASEAANSYASKYQYMANGNARVPEKYFDVVNQNADTTLNNIEKNAVVPSVYGMNLPGSAMTSEGYFNYVKNSHSWVTSPNEDAILLKDGQNKYVKDKNGNPISVPFSSLLLPKQTKPNSNPLGIYG